MKELWKEFLAFLDEYKIVGIAIGFVMGQSVNSLARSFVDNLVMPLASPFLKVDAIATAVTTLGPFTFNWGAFLNELINFIVIAVVVFLVIKKLLVKKVLNKTLIS